MYCQAFYAKPHLTHPVCFRYTKIKAEAVNSTAHWESNLDAASQGLVLLPNLPEGLPLSKGGKLAVVGPHAVSTRGLLSDYYGDQVSICLV